MRRRDFLIATAAIAAASAAPALAALRRAAPGHSHRLLRLDAHSGHFLDELAAPATTAAGPLRVHFERLIPARHGGLAALDVSVLFDSGGEMPWRHVAWRYRRGDSFGSSRGNSFVAMPGALRALEFDCHDGVHARRERCACDTAGGLPLAPGRYLLAFAGGGAQARQPLRFSGDWRQPLADSAQIDCLSVRIETEAPGPDLSLRADLACMAAAAGACAPA